MKKNILLGLLLSIISSLIINRLGEKQIDKRIEMGELSFGIVSDKPSLDPVKTWKTYEFLIIQCIYQSLLRYDDENNLQGYAASKWEISDDGLTYDFFISKKSFFSDGSKLTAKDAAYSLAAHAWPSEQSVIKSYLENSILGYEETKDGSLPKGILVLNDTTLRIKLKRRELNLLRILTMPGFSIKKHLKNKNFQLIGSGPFFLSSSQENKITLEKNIRSNIFNIKSKKLYFSFFDQMNDLLEALNNNEVDVSLNPTNDTNELKILNQNITSSYANSLSTVYTFINPRDHLNKSLEIRRSVGTIIHTLFNKNLQLTKAFTQLETFIPPGLLPLKYYERRIIKNSISNELEVIKKYVSQHGKIQIIVSNRLFNPKETKKINQLFSLYKDIFSIKFLSGKEYVETVKKGSYQVNFIQYMGNYPDPSGFYGVLNETELFGKIIESKSFFTNINKIDNKLSKIDRLSAISNAIKNYEDQWYLTPIFQLKIFLLHSDKITIPDTTFRYEAELWKFID